MHQFDWDTGWFKSSRSGGGNDHCVEVRLLAGQDAQWFKSSYSSNNSDNCVEARLSPGRAWVRDSKDREGGVLAFDSRAWSVFLGGLKRGNLA